MPPSRLLFLDSGLGGLTVLGATRLAAPGAEVWYIADDEGFPYGAKSEGELVARLLRLVRNAHDDFAADCVILACNTASTIALAALRAAFPMPFVGTVPAIKPAAALTTSGMVSVLATMATIGREYTRDLIARFGGGARFTLVGSATLAAVAEEYASGGRCNDDAIARDIAPCFVENGGKRTDVVVLGCTHYPLLTRKLETLAPWPVIWLDPAPAVARRVASLLGGHELTRSQGRGTFRFTSGKTPSLELQSLLDTYGLSTAAPLPAARP